MPISVFDIKSEIATEKGYPTQLMHLFLVNDLDRELDTYECMSDAQICQNILDNGILLHLFGTIWMRNHNENKLKGTCFEIDIEANDTVKTLKSKISKRYGIALNTQKVYVNEYDHSRVRHPPYPVPFYTQIPQIELRDTQKLCNFFDAILDGGLILHTGSFDKSGKIFTENPVQCRDLIDKDYVQIFLKTLTGKCITIHINEDDTIGWLTMKIQKMSGIQPKFLRLVFGGRQLDNGIFTLRDYHIRRESTIQMLMRLLGN